MIPALRALPQNPSNLTSLRMAGAWHKGLLMAAGLLTVCLVSVASAQAQEEQRPVVTRGQVLSFGGSAVLYGLSVYLDAHAGPPSCAPCDPEALPWFDRFAVGVPHPTWDRASDVTLLGLGGISLLDTGIRAEQRGNVVVTLEGVAWTYAVTEVAKALIKRGRPIMYTDHASAVAPEVGNQRSMWSGHTSVAFAFATGYVLNNPDQNLAPKIAAVFAAAGVGALRVAAHKHFLSDVLVGAIVGSAGALIVHEIRY